MVEGFVNVSGARVLIAPVLLLRLALRPDVYNPNALRNEVTLAGKTLWLMLNLDQWNINTSRKHEKGTLSGKMLWLKLGLSVGMLFAAMSVLSWIALPLFYVGGVLFWFYPPLLFLCHVGGYIVAVGVPAYSELLAAVFLVPILRVVYRMEPGGRRTFVRQVAICHYLVALPLFVVYAAVFMEYGTVLAANTPERDQVVRNFTPHGVVGFMMFLGGVALSLLNWWASWRQNFTWIPFV